MPSPPQSLYSPHDPQSPSRQAAFEAIAGRRPNAKPMLSDGSAREQHSRETKRLALARIGDGQHPSPLQVKLGAQMMKKADHRSRLVMDLPEEGVGQLERIQVEVARRFMGMGPRQFRR